MVLRQGEPEIVTTQQVPNFSEEVSETRKGRSSLLEFFMGECLMMMKHELDDDERKTCCEERRYEHQWIFDIRRLRGD
jgi:hypothetical protein